MITGEIEEIDDTIPVAVCFTAISEQATPMNGPNTAPNDISSMARLFANAVLISVHLPWMVIIAANPTKAAISLICVAAKGLYVPIPILLQISPSACPNAPMQANIMPWVGRLNCTLFSAVTAQYHHTYSSHGY